MLHFLTHVRVAIVTIGHDVDVNVAVPGVAKTSDRKSVLRVQPLGELDKIDNVAARNDHILIQFGEAGRAQ